MGRWGRVVLLGPGVVFAACGGGDDSGGSKAADGMTEADKTAGGGTPVGITNFVYEPKELTVPPGTKVTWVNNDSARHNLQDLSELKNSDQQGPQQERGVFDHLREAGHLPVQLQPAPVHDRHRQSRLIDAPGHRMGSS